MKKYIPLLFLISVFWGVGYLFFHYALHDDELEILRVGVECAHAPYNWEENTSSDSNFPLVNVKGSYVEGYDVQMAALVAEKLGVKIEFKKIEWDDLLSSLVRNEIDAIFSGMVDTDERKKIVNFTVPYEVEKVEYSVLVNSGSKFINAQSIQDLAGARMIAQEASRFDEVIDQISGVIHLAPLVTEELVLDEIENFRADGTVVNHDTGLSFAKSHKNLKLIRFSEGNGFNLGFTGLCAGVRKSDNRLLQKMNDIIKNISLRQRQRMMDRVILNEWEYTTKQVGTRK